MTTRIPARLLASLILALGAATHAWADDPRGYANVQLSNLQLVTSPVGNNANGGYTRAPELRTYAEELVDTRGQIWADGGTGLNNMPLYYSHLTPEHDVGAALSYWSWFSSTAMGNSSMLSEQPAVHDWTSSFAEQSVQTIFHLAPMTRLTLTADLDLAAVLTDNAHWGTASYDFYSVFMVVGATDGQSIHRAGAVGVGESSTLDETFSFSLENTGTSTMDIVWQRDASTFVGALAVPEPAPVSMALAGGGLLFWVARRRAARVRS